MKVSFRSAIIAIAMTTPIFLGACGSTTKAAATAKEIFVSGCGYEENQKPDSITLACADGGIYVDSISWSTWGGKTAAGTGKYHMNSCTPDCASGTYSNVPVKVTLSAIIPQKKSKKLMYSKILVDAGQKIIINGGKTFATELDVDRVSEGDAGSSASNVPAGPAGWDSNLKITAEQGQCYTDMNRQSYCHVYVHVSNVGNEPDSIYGKIRLQTDDGKWYEADTHPNGNLSPLVDVTLNPDTTLNSDVTIHAANGRSFVYVEIYNDATEGDGDVVVGDADITISA